MLRIFAMFPAPLSPVVGGAFSFSALSPALEELHEFDDRDDQ